MRQRFLIDRPDRGEQAKRDRKVEMRSFLGQIGRRKVDGDDLWRKREADRAKRTAHSFAALGDSFVGQANDDESRQTGRQLDLDFDGTRLEPQISDGRDQGDHQRRPRNAGAFDATRYSGKHPPSSAKRC